MQKYLCALALVFCCHHIAYAQPEAAVWYFGSNAGLDFRQSPPKPLKDGKMSTTEGGTSICDSKGDLLFYTNGINVWNKKHELMDRGVGLFGNPSSTQSGVIVPLPKNKHKYYIFAVDAEGGANGVTYSIVDMSTSEGLGSVIEANVPIFTPATEKITAVAHANGKDIWILTHLWNSDIFHAYLLTEAGFQKTPVVSAVGAMHEGNTGNTIGCMKVSPDGKKLALAIKTIGYVELFDFSTKTGKISNPIRFEFGENALMYGIEFSSDNSKLYVTAGSLQELYQIDLKAGSPDAIFKSKIFIARNAAWSGCLQLAPDGKIYAAIFGAKYLGIIHYPNRVGKACEYIEQGIFLDGQTSNLNLPTFVQTYFDDRENLSYIKTNSGGFTKMGEVFYKNVLFEFDKYDIRTEYYKDLDDLVNYLKLSTQVQIEITGHTDSDGTAEKNLILSQNRAKSVANYLIGKGIEAKRIKTQGFGLTKPIAPNTTPEGKAQNRRIEFILNK